MKYFEKYGKVIAMSAAALGMTATLAIESSMAYFTTYVSAGGSLEVNLGAQTEIHEDVSLMTKHIQIANTSMINDCFVRVKVLYGGDVTIGYPDSPDTPANENWYTDGTVDENGFRYVYYRPILPASPDPEHPSLTEPALDVKINLPEGFDRDNFNVVVVQECTPVVYDESGNATANWEEVYSEYEEIEDNSGEHREEADD